MSTKINKGQSLLISVLMVLLALPTVARSQVHYYTQLSATVRDPNGNPYASGSWQANLSVANVPVGSLVTFQGSTSFQTSFGGQLDGSGKFTVSLPDNNVIVPVGNTQWNFKFCQFYATGTQSPAPTCFGLTLTITGTSMDITSQVQAAAAPLSLPTVVPLPLSVLNGGTGTGTPGITFGNPISLSSPLSILNGGTGTATPALVAGTGIALSGAWPNETISSTATGANLTLSNLTNPTSLNVPALDFVGAAGLTALGSNNPVTLTPSGTANVIIGLNGLQFPDATVQATAAVAGPTVVATVNLTNQTAAIGTTTLFTPTAQGMYLLTLVPYLDSPTGSSTISVTVVSLMHGFSVTVPNTTTTTVSAGQNFRFSTWGFYPDASTAIQYSTSWTSGGVGDFYDLHLELVKLQ